MAESRTRGKGKANGMLARRKAALERAASRVAEERRAAAQAEAARLRREEAFDELAVDFELAVEDEQAVAARVEEEVRRVRKRGQVRINEARVAAARVVLAMGEAGETVAGCGRRLGVGVERVKELRRLGREGLAGEGSQTAPDKDNPREKSKVVKKVGGEQQGGVRAAGPGAVSPGAGAAPVAEPGVSAPAVPPAPAAAAAASPPVVVPGGPSAGSSGSSVGGVRPGWPESSR